MAWDISQITKYPTTFPTLLSHLSQYYLYILLFLYSIRVVEGVDSGVDSGVGPIPLSVGIWDKWDLGYIPYPTLAIPNKFLPMTIVTDLKQITSPNQAFTWWLIHCYLYYHAHQSIISDADFDKLNGWLKLAWNNVNHPHKHLVTIEDLNAGSGYAIRFPLRVEAAAWQALRDHNTTARPTPPPPRGNPQAKLAKPATKRNVKQSDTLSLYDSLFGSSAD